MNYGQKKSGKETRWMGQLNAPRFVSSYEEAEKLYESIKPIQGNIAHADIRPLSGRSRKDMRIVKRENEYILTDDWWSMCIRTRRMNRNRQQAVAAPDEVVDRVERFISHTPDGVTIYHPVGVQNGQGKWKLIAKDFPIGNFCFLDRFLPREMSAVRYDGKVYIQIEDKNETFRQYLVSPTLEGLKFKNVKGRWQCLNPEQEVKRSIDRKAVNKWIAEKSEDYTRDVLSYLEWVDETQLDTYRGDIYNGRDDLAAIQSAMESSPHTVAVAIRNIWRYNTYHPKLRAVRKAAGEDEKAFASGAIRLLALYAGKCWKEQLMPVGAVCLNSRHATKARETVLMER